MHYKNGREAKVGDKVVGKDWLGSPFSGVLVNVNSQSETCNGNIVPIRDMISVTLKELLHVDDIGL